VVRVRLDRKATSISLLVVIGVRDDGQKVHRFSMFNKKRDIPGGLRRNTN
jgi:hypothetical protein